MSGAPTPPISRRRFLTATAALGGGGLLAAGGVRPRAARAQGSLKGTKLTIIAGDWYVPETNKMLDELVAGLSKDTGMEVQGRALRRRAAGGQGGGDRRQRRRAGTSRSSATSTPTSTATSSSTSPRSRTRSGKTYGGWYDIAQQACVVKGRWKALMIGQAPAAWNYRTDMFRAAGVEKFPDTFDELLAAAKKLHAKGTPIGMTLGHASGDGRSTNYPVLWAFGGKEFEADGKTVAINSPQTLKAVEWYAEIVQVHGPGGDRLARPGQQPGVPGGQGVGHGQRQHDLPRRPDRRAHRPRQEDADREHGPRQLAGGPGRALRPLQHQPLGGLRPQQEPRGSARLPAGLARPRASSRSGRRRGSPTSSRRSSASRRRTSGPTTPSSRSSAS